ncbi:MAG TPA: type II secretion system protein [Solirubrobacteraceae bacterium]
MTARRTLRRLMASSVERAREERGDTLIEVAVAALIAITLISALTGLFLSGNDETLAAQRQTELIGVADQQIENIRDAVKVNGFSALAMKTAPVTGSSTTLTYSGGHTYIDPNHFVVSSCGANGGYTIENNYDNTSQGTATIASWTGCPTGVEPLVVLSTGIVTAQQTSVAVGAGTATVDSYVTDTNVGACATPTATTCTGAATTPTGDARRVIVAVKLNGVTRYDRGDNSPVYVSTIFTDPVPSNQANASVGLSLGTQIG